MTTDARVPLKAQRTNQPHTPIYFDRIAEPWRTLLAQFLRYCERMDIASKDDGTVRLILREPQRYFIEEVFAGFTDGLHDFVVVKARQLGISTVLWAFDLFWLTRFSLQGLYVTDDEPNKEIHRGSIGEMYKSLPANLSRGPWLVNNRYELRWQSRPTWRASRLMWAFANKKKEGQLGRSRGANYIHAEEMDSWGDPDAPAALDAARSSSHPRRAYFWVGTGQGYSLLYEMWEQATHGTSAKAIFVGFWRDPDKVVHPDEQAKWAAYGEPRATPEENEWREQVRSRYGVVVNRGQLAWWRWTLAEGKGINGDQAKMMQEHPWCLTGATRISTCCGIIPLAEATAGHGTESGVILGVYPQGSRDTVRVTTRDGRVLVGTADHPMEAPDGSIVRLGDSLGRLLPLRAPRFADEAYRMRWELFGGARCELEVDEVWGRFLGYYAGDGCFHNGYLSITCNAKDTDVVEDVRGLMVRLFGGAQERLCGRRHGNPDRLGWIELRRGCAEFPALAKRLGIWKDDKPHRRVCVPEAIFRSPKSVVREFLRGLFEADGFNGYHARRVSLFSKWPAFLRDVQLLLLGFGITSRIKAEPKKRPDGRTHSGYALGLRSREAALFNERVGFVGQRKRSRDDHKPFATRPSLPIEMTDEVAGVESAGAELVYDITIDERHTFSANGLVSHNCPEQSFQASGSQFLSARTCLAVRTALRRAPEPAHYRYEWGPYFDTTEDVLIEVPKEAATLTVWEEAQPNMVYVLGADPAFGRGGTADRYAITVWRCHPDALVQAAEYCTPEGFMYQFAWVLVHLCGYFRIDDDAFWGLDVNGPGRAVDEEIIRMASFNYGVLRRSSALTGVLGGMRRFMESRSDTMTQTPNWHFSETVEARIQMFEQLRDSVERGAMVIRSERLAEEIAALRRSETGKVEAGGVQKDDLAFASALANRIWLQNVLPEIEEQIAPLVPPRDAPATTGERLLRGYVNGMDSRREDDTAPLRVFGVRGPAPGRGRR